MSNNTPSLKSSIHQEMEFNGEAIYQSWLKDTCRVPEMHSITTMLTSILSHDSLLTFFNNLKEDLTFFLTTFSNQVITNILRQSTVYGDNAEEASLSILSLYLQLFIKHLNDPIILPLYPLIKDIFDYSKPYYKDFSKNPTSKKRISADEYNINYLPRKPYDHMQIESGQEIDVMTEYFEKQNQRFKTWVRGLVTGVFDNYFTVKISTGDPSPLLIKYDSFEYRPCGSMTKDWNWRKNLQIGDMVDCYDRRRFYPGVIVEKNVTSSSDGLSKIVYRVTFRVFQDMVGDISQYKRFWPKREVERDRNGRITIGDPSNFDENLDMFSKYICPPNSKVFTEGITKIEYYDDKYDIDAMILPENTQGEKTIVIGRQNHHSFLYNYIITFFGRLNGFEALLSSLSLTSTSSNTNQSNSDLFFTICHIMKKVQHVLYQPLVISIATKLQSSIFAYISSITNAELRNVKKEHIEIIGDILTFYLGVLLGEDKRDELLEEFNISFAMKMIKTSYLDKRINAIKTIIDLIRNNNEEGSDKERRLLDLLEQNHIFYEIYGPNSHVQLITKSKELLEIMLQHDKLSNEEIEMIWTATRKGDLESKLTILTILKELSLSGILQPKHVNKLLNNILSTTSSDLLDQELDLIYELSLNQHDDSMTEKCIESFTAYLLGCDSDQAERIDFLVNKIYVMTRRDPVFKVNVIKMAMTSLEENKNSAIGMKILSVYITGSGANIVNDYDMDRLLIEDDQLVNLYIKSFKEYMDYVKSRYVSKGGEGDFDTLTLNDKFNHSHNIKARLSFLSELVNSGLWRINDDPIDFAFRILVENSICVKDEQQFYHWIKEVIYKCSYETEVKLFELFIKKIGKGNHDNDNEDNEDDHTKNKSSAMNCSIEAFDTFVKVFNDINIKNQKIIQKNDENDPSKIIDVLIVQPRELDGFDILWKIIFESYSDEIMNKGIETLYSLFSNYLNENDSNMNQLQDLIQLCLKEIQSASNPNKSRKSLRIIKRIIEESEKYGTANIISHNSLLKRTIITINVTSYLRTFYYYKKKEPFTLKLYSNTTIFDLKTTISSLMKYHHDFIKFTFLYKDKAKYDLSPRDNGKTLHMFNFPNNTIDMNLNDNGLEASIPQQEICANKQLTEKALKVFHYWFDLFSTNNRMGQEDCARFVGAVTNSSEEVALTDNRVRDLFNERDKNRDNIIEREDFLQFYYEAASDKPVLVFENLRTMGIRNDLMNLFDPYYLKEPLKKETLPRYQLAMNEEFFNSIFNMQKGNDELSIEAFEFIGMLSTNPMIYNKILSIGDSSESNSEYLNGDNVVKLIYSLQIIESLIEGIKDNEDIVEGDKSRKWLKAFIMGKGYEQCVKLFQSKLRDIIKQQNNHFDNLCLQYLIQIIKAFYIASINDITTTTSANDKDKNKDDSITILQDYLQHESLCLIIQEPFKDDQLIQSLISALDIFIKNQHDKESNFNILNPIIELITILIPSSITSSSQINPSYWIPIFTYGLLHHSERTRHTFTHSAMRMCSILQKRIGYEFIQSFFNHCYLLISKHSNNNDQSAIFPELFSLFTFLLEIYTNNKEEFNAVTSSFNIEKFIDETIGLLSKKINDNDLSPEDIFIGYLTIITRLSNSNEVIKTHISEQSNLMQDILTRILFKQADNAQVMMMQNNKDKDKDKNAYVDIDQLSKVTFNQKGSERLRMACYDFILSIIKGSVSNFERFLTVDIISKDDDDNNNNNDSNGSEDAAKSNKKSLKQSNEFKCENHVGLKNLGCICYMNSTLQQFYMVPSLRHSLLRCNDLTPDNIDPGNGIDDNMLHQVQKMFSYLEISHRIEYNPFPFTYSFKDWDGLPTKLIEQKDAQEFLSIFLDRLESECKPTEYKYLLQSIFGGKNCSQVICSQCGKVSNRYEDLVFLSLEVKNMKTLNDSLDKMISEEMIDGYKCDGCNENVTITKRNLLSSLPNVLIVHLQRICYNLEYDHNEKINSRLEFPRQINLKPYTIEEIMRKNNSNSNGNEGIEGDNEVDDVYFKSDAYYDYYLMGVIVHVGSADSGHYYSYINTCRGGNDFEAEYDPKDNTMSASWLEFNDTNISKFDVSKLENECFGGINEETSNTNQRFALNKREKCRNAYMLVYERKIKSPLKVIVDPSSIPNLNPNIIISYKQEEEKKIMKQYDICRYYNTPDFKEKQCDIMSKVFNDVHRNEYFKFQPFYYTDRKMAMKYYMEIYEDNSQLEKMKNISDEQFTKFFEKIIVFFEETVFNDKTKVTEETAVKISMTFLNFIFTRLTKKDKGDLLIECIDRFIKIVKMQRICLESTWSYIRKHYEVLKGRLFNENKQTVTAYCKLIGELMIMLIKDNEEDKEEFIKCLKRYHENYETIGNAKQGTKIEMGLWVFMQIIWSFPKIPTKSLENMQSMFSMIQSILDSSEELLIYMGNNEFLFIFITFLIGKDSPCYEQTFNKRFDYWDHDKRSGLIQGGETLVDIIYRIFSYSMEGTNHKIQLSSRDLECLTCTSYLSYIFKNFSKYLSKHLILLSANNCEFTLNSCHELLHQLNSYHFINDAKAYISLLKDTMDLFALKDEYQQIRLEHFWGIPQFIIEESVPFPLIGYNMMTERTNRYIASKSYLKSTFKVNYLQRLFELKGNDDYAIEALLVICENCLTNRELYRYLLSVPYENMTSRSLFEWGMTIVNNAKSNNDTHSKLKEVLMELKQLNTNDVILNDHSILPLFNGFYMNDYLIRDIKRVEIQLIQKQNNVSFFICDYYANTIPLTQSNPESIDHSIEPIDFTYSKRNYNLNFVSSTPKEVIPEENNDPNQQDIVYLEAESVKFLHEKDLLINLSQKLSSNSNYKKAIIETKYSVPNAKSIYRRIIALNTSNQFPIVVMKLKRMSTVIENVNEFIPETTISITFNLSSVMTIFSMTKFNIDKEWTWEFTTETLQVKAIFEQNKYGSVSYTDYSDYSQFPMNEYVEYGLQPHHN